MAIEDKPVPSLGAGLTLVLGLVLGALAACFEPPADPVLFSCEHDGDDSCPPDYRCELDNCCHRVGSDVDANFGSCALGGNSAGMGTGTDSGTDSGTDTGADTGTDTGTETG